MRGGGEIHDWAPLMPWTVDCRVLWLSWTDVNALCNCKTQIWTECVTSLKMPKVIVLNFKTSWTPLRIGAPLHLPILEASSSITPTTWQLLNAASTCSFMSSSEPLVKTFSPDKAPWQKKVWFQVILDPKNQNEGTFAKTALSWNRPFIFLRVMGCDQFWRFARHLLAEKITSLDGCFCWSEPLPWGIKMTGVSFHTVPRIDCQILDGHWKRQELTMNQSETTLFRSGNLKGLVFLSPDSLHDTHVLAVSPTMWSPCHCFSRLLAWLFVF